MSNAKIYCSQKQKSDLAQKKYKKNNHNKMPNA